MAPVAAGSEGAAAERRERRRAETRARIQAAAMELFVANGFEKTTVDEIAVAADISRRSFFHHFTSKESVVFAWQNSYGGMIEAALAERPPEEGLATAALEAVMATLVAADPRALIYLDLIRATPVLRARDHANNAIVEECVYEALLKRAGPDATQLDVRLLAMAVMGTLRVAGDIWMDRQAEDPIAYFRKAIERTRFIAATLEFGSRA